MESDKIYLSNQINKKMKALILIKAYLLEEIAKSSEAESRQLIKELRIVSKILTHLASIKMKKEIYS